MTDASSEKPLVLVIDDDPDIRAFLGALLSADARTIDAGSGDDGIAVARTRAPDLILLDLMMPGTGGYEVIKQLKHDPETRHIPIIFITAQADKAFEAAAIKLGAIDYIVKPFDAGIVAGKVRSHLDLIRRGDRAVSALRRRWRRGALILAGTVAGLIVAAALAHLLLRDGGSEIARALRMATMSRPAPTVPKTGQDAPSQGPAEATPPPAAVPPGRPSPAFPQESGRPARDTRPAVPALVDGNLPQPAEPYAWVEAAHCGVVPLEAWWQNATAQSIALHVERNLGGDWASYALKWREHLFRTEDTMARGGAVTAPDGRIVEGPALREYVAKLRKRVDATTCLERAVNRGLRDR